MGLKMLCLDWVCIGWLFFGKGCSIEVLGAKKEERLSCENSLTEFLKNQGGVEDIECDNEGVKLEERFVVGKPVLGEGEWERRMGEGSMFTNFWEFRNNVTLGEISFEKVDFKDYVSKEIQSWMVWSNKEGMVKVVLHWKLKIDLK